MNEIKKMSEERRMLYIRRLLDKGQEAKNNTKYIGG